MVNLTGIFVGLIFICTALVTAFVIPLLREQRGKIKDSRIRDAMDNACRWAEQKLTDISGPEKRIYVLTRMREWLEARGYTYNADELDIYLEASVHDINSVLEFESSMTVTDEELQ